MATNRIVPKILVAGRTGAGKSSLLNAILGKEAFRTGIRPTTMGFDVQRWASPWGEVEVIDSRGFAEADSAAAVAHGGSVIQKGYEEAHVCLLVIPAANRDLERESRWVADAKKHGLFEAVPVFLVVSRLDEIAPTREWNPESLNLDSPTTAKEINIRAKLDYLKSLSAFTDFFSQNRVVPVSAGQSDGADGAFNTAPFGIQTLQERIFQILPDAVKTEYARMFRRIELVRQSVESLVSTYITLQVIYGIGCFAVFSLFRLYGIGAGMASGIAGFFGANESAASYAHIASVSNFIAFLFFFVLPIGFQFLVVRDIAKRHGFENLNLLKLLGMICRHPALLKKFKPRSADWLWIIGLYCCCCSPIGVGLFLTRPLAQGFNEICYQFRMNASQQEMEDALKQ